MKSVRISLMQGIASLAILASVVACAPGAGDRASGSLAISTGTQGIFGGEEIRSSADVFRTFVVSIENRYDDSNDCTGTVIASRVILTAAHCLGEREDGHEFIANSSVRFFGFHSREADGRDVFPG